jgi:hypothetical protein
VSALDEIIIREYREGDEEQIIDLYNDQYNANRTLKEWRWEYINGPSGPAIIAVAEFDGRIVGMRTELPIPLYYKGLQILSGKNETSIIIKEYRGIGLFQLLCQKSMEIAKKRGMEILWGFTYAKKSYESMAGFCTNGRVKHLMILPSKQGLNRIYKDTNLYIRANKINKFFIKNLSGFIGFIFYAYYRINLRNLRIAEGYVIKEIRDLKIIARFWREYCKQSNACSIDRQEDYMKWRLHENPYIKFHIFCLYKNKETRGFIIAGVNKKKRKGTITDICLLKDNYYIEANWLIRYVVSFLSTLDLDIIDSWIIGNGTETRSCSKALRRTGFIPMSFTGSPMELVLLSDKDELKDLQDKNNWYITELFSEGIG